MERVHDLCGMIHRQYSSESEFARALGWNRQRLNRITTGRREPTLDEVAQISTGLGQPIDVVANIFLRTKSPNGQLMEG